MVAVNRLQAAVAKAGRFLAVLVTVGAGLYESARLTVRMPLAIPVGLAGLVLVLLAALCRRPPRDLFTDRPAETAPEQRPAPAAIAPPRVHAPAHEAVATWAFDEEF